jgi:hypothetical protein
MTDKEIKNCNCEEHDGCDCGDDCESNVITLDLEDGPHDFNILSMVELKGKKFLALSEVGSMEYDIFQMTEDGDSIELSYVEDDDDFNAVADEFDKIFSSEMDDEEDEEEEN